MRTACLFLGCLVATHAMGQQTTFDVTIGGSKVGQCVATRKADGSFTSTTSIDVAGVSIRNAIEGAIKDGRLSRLKTTSSQGRNSALIEWDGSKFTVTTDGKAVRKDVPYKPTTSCAFSAYHPWINSLLWTGMKGTPGKSRVLFVDSFAEMPMEFTSQANTVAGKGGPMAVSIWTVDLGGTRIETAFTPEGRALGVNVPSQKAMFLETGLPDPFVDPLAKYPELSQPAYPVKTLNRVRQKMRDGVELMADVAMPTEPGKYPTILIRTPYGRKASLLTESWYAARGYVVVAQDVRGRGGSNGAWDPLVNEKRDGYDTLSWIAGQPWSDGNVGMIGGSYLGYVQWAAAATGHPALKCIVPQVSPPPPDRNFPWDHGAFMLISNLWWCRIVKDRASGTAGALDALENLDLLKTLPVTKVDDRYFGQNIPFFDAWAKRTTLADWGDVFTLADVARSPIPSLHVSGLWDGDGIGTALHWSVRRPLRPQWLVFGPWTHIFNTSHKYGDQEYGAGGILELNSVYLRFFDSYLKARKVDLDKERRVRFFVTGRNQWIETDDWPMPGAVETVWHLSSGKGAGNLIKAPGKGKSSYAYDPNNPEFKEKRIDINIGGSTTIVPKQKHGTNSLIFQTAPFAQPTTLAAPVEVELYVSTTVRDATFHVSVLDIDGKGVLRIVGLPGTQRATYVGGTHKSLTPGKVYSVKVVPWWFAHRFAKGHRLALMVASDSYPRFARNPGTGEPEWKATKLLKATHTVWTDAARPSKVKLYRLPEK